MRQMLSLCLIVFLAVAPAGQAGPKIIPCRAKTWFENVRTDEKRVCRQMDAGSAYVAVLSVAPWEDYVAKMQPDFAITEEKAFQEALPVTSTHESTVVDALAAAVTAALPTPKQPDSKPPANDTRTPANGDSETNGDTSGKTGNTTQAGDKDKDDAETHPTTDPMMRRLNAQALFQEARLQSLRIVDTAVPSGYTAYVVSLQVTLMPNARREPYDAYTTVTFVPADHQESETKVIRIVPLLVTDNIESTRRAELAQQIRDLSLAASAMAGNTGLTASARKHLDRMVNAQSTDFNSLMTVARLSENSLRVRLGAIRGNDRYSIVPRTHNITLVVMAPENMKELAYISRTQLVDAVHGTPLSAGTTGVFGWRLENVIGEWVRDYELPDDPGYYVELMSLAQSADYVGFRDHLLNAVFADAGCDSRCKLLNPNEHAALLEKEKQHQRKVAEELAKAADEGQRIITRRAKQPEVNCRCTIRAIDFSQAFRDQAIERIWADMSNYNGTGQYSKGLFALPDASSKPRRFFPKTSVTPIDNTVATTVMVRGARFVDAGRVRARLRIVNASGGEYYLDATNIVEKRYGEVEITFPSVRKLVPKPETDLKTGSALMLSYAPSSYRWNTTDPFKADGDADVATLNAGGEVPYPVTGIVLADAPAPKEEKPATQTAQASSK